MRTPTRLLVPQQPKASHEAVLKAMDVNLQRRNQPTGRPHHADIAVETDKILPWAHGPNVFSPRDYIRITHGQARIMELVSIDFFDSAQ